MPIQKFTPKPGVNRENTRLFNEGGWWESDKVRFRQGTPERIGGWVRKAASSFLGVCRSITTWADLKGNVLNSVGTHLKYYVEASGTYADVTPLARVAALTNPFVATAGSSTVTVTDAAHGRATGSFVTFSGATGLSSQAFTVTIATPGVLTLTTPLAQNTAVTLSTTGALPTGLIAGDTYYCVSVSGSTCSLANTPDGAPITTSGTQSGTHTLQCTAGATSQALTGSFQITVVDANSYTIALPVAATSYDTGGGGAVQAYYEIAPGGLIATQRSGWDAGAWGAGTWGIGAASTVQPRIWSQANFGQDLIFGYAGGALYYYNSAFGTIPQPVGITIATPAVVSLPVSVPYNTALMLETTGALPTGLSPGTVYYVVNPVGATCNLAATPGGAPIATSGTQSGTHTLSLRGIPLTALAGASGVPVVQNRILVSDTSRFVLTFGVNPLGQTEIDPMFIRWSAQESSVDWSPSATNQAGGIRLSQGSAILAAVQTRQEIVVFTDTAVYSLQYAGPPYVWQSQLLGSNTSFVGVNTMASASGVLYWMGTGKFFKYDGRVQTMRCDLKQYIFGDINMAQAVQFFAGTVEAFNEVWWFYCSANSDTIDRYVVYNYLEDVWAYGTMARTAWSDSGLNQVPVAAAYEGTLVLHETGLDDNVTGTPKPIYSFIRSSEFDIGDGDRFGFAWRLLPDLSFRGSTATNPTGKFTLNTLTNSGSGYEVPASEGGANEGTVTGDSVYPVEKFTGQINIRIRGRQMSMMFSSEQLGTTWQLGATRIDVRQDGRR